jgi:hypothetical protein
MSPNQNRTCTPFSFWAFLRDFILFGVCRSHRLHVNDFSTDQTFNELRSGKCGSNRSKAAAYGPAGLSQEIIARLNTEIGRILFLPIPHRHLEAGDCFRHGWHLRQKPRTLGFGDSQQP